MLCNLRKIGFTSNDIEIIKRTLFFLTGVKSNIVTDKIVKRLNEVFEIEKLFNSYSEEQGGKVLDLSFLVKVLNESFLPSNAWEYSIVTGFDLDELKLVIDKIENYLDRRS